MRPTPTSSIRTATLCVSLWLVLAGSPQALAADAVLPPEKIASLIKRERPAVADPWGWATDMLAAFDEISQPATRENVCAGIAVISQESGFLANPAVPGLGRISEQALRRRMGAYPLIGGRIIDYLETTPQAQGSFMDRIRAAKTERDLDLVYRALIDEIGARTELQFILDSGVLNRMIEQRNEISTIGSMQVSVAFAVAIERQNRWTPMSLKDVYRVRDRLYTRRGGMAYGLRQLLNYETGYDRKVYRFADYNAGRYASRNAAFQSIAGTLSGTSLAHDGDLLAYGGNGKPSGRPGNTELAVRAIIAKAAIPLKPEDIRRDLAPEKSAKFTATETFKAVRDLYQHVTGKAAPFAMLPDIKLKSEKIASRMTTAIFAERVNARYRRCMKKP